jgi:hypothetical protein
VQELGASYPSLWTIPVLWVSARWNIHTPTPTRTHTTLVSIRTRMRPCSPPSRHLQAVSKKIARPGSLGSCTRRGREGACLRSARGREIIIYWTWVRPQQVGSTLRTLFHRLQHGPGRRRSPSLSLPHTSISRPTSPSVLMDLNHLPPQPTPHSPQNSSPRVLCSARNVPSPLTL